MPDISNTNPQPEESPSGGGWLEYLAWIGAAAGFSPALYWLGKAVVDSQQLRDAFIILVVAGIVMAMEHGIFPTSPALTKMFWRRLLWRTRRSFARVYSACLRM